MGRDIAELLARFAEKGFSHEGGQKILQMLENRPDLQATLEDLLEVDAMESSGALPPLTEGQQAGLAEVFNGDHAGAVFGGVSGVEQIFSSNYDRITSLNDSPDIDAAEFTASSQERRDMMESINEVFNAPQAVGEEPAPDLLSLNVIQGQTDSCAVKCQEIILEDYGVEVDSGELLAQAEQQGWYLPGFGSPAEDVGRLLEAHGLEVSRYEDANIFNLVSELAQGHRVILLVDSGELWSSNEVLQSIDSIPPEFWEDGVADHAIIVSGVDVSDPTNPVVVVTDPGTGQVAATYPLEAFIDAWADSGFSMIATNDSPAEFALDHVDHIGDMSYQEFSDWYSARDISLETPEHFQKRCDWFRQHCQLSEDQLTDPMHRFELPDLPDVTHLTDNGILHGLDSLHGSEDTDMDVDSDGLFPG